MTGRGPRGRARSRPAESANQPSSEPTEPPIVPPSEGGRGRGLAGRTEPPASESTTSASGHSPTSSDEKKSDGSPPKVVASIGRAAMRGKKNAPASVDSNLVEPLTRMHLQSEVSEGERQGQKTYFETVPITRPPTCTDKRGCFLKNSQRSSLQQQEYNHFHSRRGWYKNKYYFQSLRSTHAAQLAVVSVSRRLLA